MIVRVKLVIGTILIGRDPYNWELFLKLFLVVGSLISIALLIVDRITRSLKLSEFKM